MAVQQVLRMGHPLLLSRAPEVNQIESLEIQQLIQDMRDTMQALCGAGIAAPQIGVSLRVIIFGIHQNERYPDVEEIPETVLINPHITFLSEEKEQGWEGCLSVPNMRGLVPRYTSIRYSGYDEKGQFIEQEAHDFHARVVQHEVDHLDGILYPQRIEDMQYFGFESENFPPNNNN